MNFTYPTSFNLFHIWNTTGKTGTQPQFDERKNRKIKLTNNIALTLLFVSFPFSIYFYFLGFPLPGLFVGIVDLGFCLTLYFNKLNRPLYAKIWLILVANLGCYPYVQIFGSFSGIQYTFLSFSCVPFVLFELKNYHLIILSSLLSFALFFSLELHLLENYPSTIDIQIQRSIYFPMLFIVFIILLSNMFYLSFESEKAEMLLKNSKEKFEEEIKEAQIVIDSSKYKYQDNSIAEILKSQIKDLQKNEEQLKKSNEQLRRTNNDLDNFIYTASHDLKSPISNIEGLVNALMYHKHYENGEIKDIIDMMSFSIVRFKNTITELTEISKIQQDNEEAFETINLEELLEDVKFSIKDLLHVSQAIIICDFKNCGYIKFSKRNLRSILYNLVSNAVKYRSPIRQPIVHVSSEILKGEGFIQLSVKDNGLGIPAEHKNKIFSMFKRVHNHVEGSGVGLYIVKKIVDNNKGKIDVESVVDQGSIFKIFFKVQ